MPHSPFVKQTHCGREQKLCDAAVPQVGTNRQRTKKTDASPSCGEIRAYEFSSQLRGKSGGRISEPARPRVVGDPHKFQRVRHAEPSAEGETHDAVRGRQVLLTQRAYRAACRF